jgi:hypothetical protein
MKKLWLIKLFPVLIVVGFFGTQPIIVRAKDTYPKLANYYLDFFKSNQYNQLAKWDLLVIQGEMTAYNPEFFNLYRRVNPEGKLIAYTYPAFFYQEANPGNYAGLPLRKYVLDEVNAKNWWLKSGSGGAVYSWPRVQVINVTNPEWQNFNVDYLKNKLGMSQWDGVMYDMVDAEINHYSGNGIDINNDGVVDSTATVNQKWQQGMSQLFAKTRSAFGNEKIIVTNGNSIDSYQKNINGRIFENFPTPWEGNGSWQATMYQYLRRLPGLNYNPATHIINATTRNTGNMSNYRAMRFGLTSALLGDGYFSFDYGDQSHQQLWWYDEYDMKLGQAQSSYYNLLDINNDYIKAGLWRRDFENGVAIVNSTDKDQLYIFKNEEFEKLRGQQDAATNNGTKVNYIKLKPSDGIIMKSVRKNVSGQVFNNGDFLRVFEPSGQQKQSGFFAYKSDTPTNSRVLVADLDGNNKLDQISEQGGRLKISGPGRKTITIAPYGNNFKGRLSFAVFDFNKDGFQEIAIVPLTSGGPQVVIYSQSGKKLSSGFFVFDKNFRGGVNIAAGDMDGDGKGEIIVAPAKDLAPTVKIFSDRGTLVGSFVAYDKNFRGGVNVAVGDLNQDHRSEIVTGAASSGPHIRMFTSTGKLLGQFMAYDPKKGGGVRVMISDTDGDGKMEILAGTSNF